MMRKILVSFFLFFITPVFGNDNVVFDLSSHMIAVNSGFKGTDVILFGTKSQTDGNLVLVIKGPKRQFLVQKKERTLGIWMNKKRVELSGGHSFYGIYSDLPINLIASPSVIDRFGLHLNELEFDFSRNWAKPKRELFTKSFVENREDQEVYVQDEGAVHFIAPTLFRLRLHFPSHVPTGNYRVDAYLLRDGDVVNAQSVPFYITKTGASAGIYRFAKDDSFFYGLLAVIAALTLGWLGGILMRRG